MALYGHTGDVIVECDREDSSQGPRSYHTKGSKGEKVRIEDPSRVPALGVLKTFAVAEDIDFVTETEKAVLNTICEHGYFYRELCAFVARNQHLDYAQDVPTAAFRENPTQQQKQRTHTGQRGLFLRAVCVGMNEILQDYRSLVLDLEQKILAEPTISLARIKHLLRRFSVLFPPLFSLADEVYAAPLAPPPPLVAAATRSTEEKIKIQNDSKKDKLDRDRQVRLRGGQILEALHRRAQVGVPEVRECMERLLFHANRVLYNQITSFIVHGVLTDPFGEFFIHLHPVTADQGPEPPPFLGLPLPAVPPRSTMRVEAGGGGTLLNRAWGTRFGIRSKMLPGRYIPRRIAKQILFIGYAVCLLQHPGIAGYIAETYPPDPRPPINSSPGVSKSSFSARGGSRGGDEKVPQGSGMVDRRAAIRAMRRVGRGSSRRLSFSSAQILEGPNFGTGLIPRRDLTNFERTLRKLSEEPVLEPARVERALARIKATVDKYVCDLVVTKGRLMRQLRALKDLYFLARGEFYQAFIEEGSGTQGFFHEPAMSKSARPLAERAFLGAAQASSLDQDPYFSRFTLFLDEPAFHFADFNPHTADTTPAARDKLGRPPPGVPSHVHGPHQLVLRGAAAVDSKTKSLLLGSHDAKSYGVVWYRKRRRVDKQFTVTVVFQCQDEAPTTSAPPHQEAEDSKLTSTAPLLAVIIQNHSLPGLDPEADRLAIELRNASRESSRGSSQPHRQGATLVVVAGKRVLVEAPMEAALAPKARYALHVESTPGYLEATIAPTDDGAAAATGGGARVAVEVSMAKAIRLDGGRAWVGISGGGMRVASWRFRGERKSAHAWRHLRLAYRVDPPLDLVLGAGALEEYNQLFAFLFEVKHVQLALQRAWRPLRGRAGFGDGRNRGGYLQRARMLPVWALRHKMQFLVDNLQYYLQVDVFDSQHSVLEQRIHAAQGLEALQEAHRMYLHTLQRRCFFDWRVIHNAFRTVFEVCTSFCNLVTLQGDGRTLTDSELLRVEDLAKRFKRQAHFLYSMLDMQTSGRSAEAHTHLQQLVLRIDYNGSYSRDVREKPVSRTQTSAAGSRASKGKRYSSSTYSSGHHRP